MLLGAEQVAHAPYLQVAQRDLEARAELGELPDRIQSSLGLFGEDLVAVIGEISVCKAA